MRQTVYYEAITLGPLVLRLHVSRQVPPACKRCAADLAPAELGVAELGRLALRPPVGRFLAHWYVLESGIQGQKADGVKYTLQTISGRRQLLRWDCVCRA